jgi:hypothetical protein
MNERAANATPRRSQNHGEVRNANGAGSATRLSCVLLWSAAALEEGPAESWRPTSFAVSVGVGVPPAARFAVSAAGTGLGDETLKFWKPDEGEAASPTLEAWGALTVFGAGAAAGAEPALCMRGNDETTAVARNKKIAAPLAKVEKVRSGASQTGTDTRGTSDRVGTGDGSAAMSRAVPRSSARRVRQSAHVSRCACTEARASGESAPSKYAERSPNGCTA